MHVMFLGRSGRSEVQKKKWGIEWNLNIEGFFLMFEGATIYRLHTSSNLQHISNVQLGSIIIGQ